MLPATGVERHPVGVAVEVQRQAHGPARARAPGRGGRSGSARWRAGRSPAARRRRSRRAVSSARRNCCPAGRGAAGGRAAGGTAVLGDVLGGPGSDRRSGSPRSPVVSVRPRRRARTRRASYPRRRRPPPRRRHRRRAGAGASARCPRASRSWSGGRSGPSPKLRSISRRTCSSVSIAAPLSCACLTGDTEPGARRLSAVARLLGTSTTPDAGTGPPRTVGRPGQGGLLE